MTDGVTLPSRTAVTTYHTSELVSFLDRALLDTIEVTERRGLDNDYLPWSKRVLSGGGVCHRRTSRSGGPAGVMRHDLRGSPWSPRSSDELNRTRQRAAGGCLAVSGVQHNRRPPCIRPPRSTDSYHVARTKYCARMDGKVQGPPAGPTNRSGQHTRSRIVRAWNREWRAVWTRE